MCLIHPFGRDIIKYMRKQKPERKWKLPRNLLFVVSSSSSSSSSSLSEKASSKPFRSLFPFMSILPARTFLSPHSIVYVNVKNLSAVQKTRVEPLRHETFSPDILHKKSCSNIYETFLRIWKLFFPVSSSFLS